MNKSDLIKQIAKKSGISLSKARAVVNAFCNTIIKELAEGGSVQMLRFGKWSTKTRSSRRSYNIFTHRIDTIPSKRKVSFAPSKALLDKELSEAPDGVQINITPQSILTSLPKAYKGNRDRQVRGRANDLQGQVLTVTRTGIKIDTGSPNVGQRIKRPQTVETGDLQYCGKTSYYETEAPDTENYSYPVLLIPFFDTPILEYRTNRFATSGVIEPVLTKALNEISQIEPKIQILQNISVPVNNRAYGYKPDIAIIWREKNIFIDVEIDEPYDIISHSPIHYKGCGDGLRNAYFLDNGWNIIRIAEKQIVDNCAKVVDYIKLCLCQLSEDSRFKVECDIQNVNRWSYTDAQKLAKEAFRESYLGIVKIALPETTAELEADITEFSGITNRGLGKSVFVKPAEDIITDRYANMRSLISEECRIGKYIIFSIKHKCYDYVALSKNISFTQKNNFYGIELYDVIEEKSVFLRFQEIASFKSQNSITKFEGTADDDWDKILYNAILNSNPIEIEYDTADKGNPLKRTILFVTFWYRFFDENDNRTKYTPYQLLEVAASLKYETLAESTRVGYISGFCNYRQELRTFNIHRIKGGRVLECRKNLHKLSVADIWKILEKGYTEIAVSMYNELTEQEQHSLFHLGNYANALVMQGKHEDAVSVFMSIPSNRLMPQTTTTWSEACLGDFDFFIAKDIKRSEFEKIRSIMKNNGW